MVLRDDVMQIREAILDGTHDERSAAIDKIGALPDADKEALASDLRDRVTTDSSMEDWARSWSLSALVATGRDEVWPVIAQHVSDEDAYGWVRYWAVIGYAQSEQDDIVDLFASTLAATDPTSSDDVIVRSVLLRLLLDLGAEEPDPKETLDTLIGMLSDKKWWDARFFAAKAFRSHGGRTALPGWAQRNVVPELARTLRKEQGTDVSDQAAWALGSMDVEWQSALEALRAVLDDQNKRGTRRAAIDAVEELGREESAPILLDALVGTDAEVRARSAEVAEGVVGSTTAIEMIVDRIVTHPIAEGDERTLGRFLQALRRIDIVEAGQQIAVFVTHPDPAVVQRATHALEELGGASAFAALHSHKKAMLETYTALLSEADKTTTKRFTELISEARTAFTTSMWMHRIVFGVGIVALAAGLTIALVSGLDDFARFVGMGTAVGGVGLMLAHFYKDPLRNIHESLLGLLQVTIVFQGFVREVNQIDAMFKQRFLSPGGAAGDILGPSLGALRSSVRLTLDEIDTHLRIHGTDGDDGAPAAPSAVPSPTPAPAATPTPDLSAASEPDSPSAVPG